MHFIFYMNYCDAAPQTGRKQIKGSLMEYSLFVPPFTFACFGILPNFVESSFWFWEINFTVVLHSVGSFLPQNGRIGRYIVEIKVILV